MRVVLFLNAWLNPARFAPASISTTLGLAAPLILAAVASLPPIPVRSRRHRSFGRPLMGLVNVIIVRWLIEGSGGARPAIIPAALLIGMASGALNGWIAAFIPQQ